MNKRFFDLNQLFEQRLNDLDNLHNEKLEQLKSH